MTAVSCLSVLAFGLMLSTAANVRADESAFSAQLSCQPPAGPGRILCELTTRASEGKLVWSDALVVQAPAFARPLRSRFLARITSTAAVQGAFAKLALVASEAGEGQLELLARGVICHQGTGGERCEPVRAKVRVELRVLRSDAGAR